jgi:surface antigen
LNAYLIDSFACALDKQEQKKAEEATKAVLDAPADTSEKVEWVSETNEGVSGSVEATPVVVSDNGRECRTATQIGYVDGKEIRATPTFCRAKGSSNWVAQTA